MSTPNETAPVTYVFGRRDRGGLLLGFRASQLLVLGTGVTAVLVGLLTAGGRGGLVGILLCCAAGVVALVPVQGRPLVDWARPVTHYLFLRVTGRGRDLGGARALHRSGNVPRLDLPGLGQGLRVLETQTSLGPVAVLRYRDRWTIVLEVTGTSYVLADRATQQRRVTAWGALLSQTGQEGSHIAALQWLERTLPDTGRALTEWWRSHGDPSSPYAAAYEELIAGAGPAATRHETYLAVSIDGHRMRRAIRRHGGGPEGATTALLAEVAWVRQALARAEVDVVGYVGANDLARLVRTQFDPASSELIDRRPGHRTANIVPAAAAGPMASQALWSRFRSDSGIHAVYWVAEWPTVPVEAAWCYP